ncbi:hypothetical protein V6Z12_D11G145000 [Gossypium hirsutum]
MFPYWFDCRDDGIYNLLSPLEHQPTCSGEELEDHQSHLVTTTSRNLGRCVFLNRMSGLVQRKPGNK